jgi:hypothetical protein
MLIRFATILVLCATAFAQGDRGSITGTVTDPGNAVVPAAKVAAKNSQTGALYETVTTPSGIFAIAALPVGTYDITVESPGFSRKIQQGVQVQVAQTTRADIALQVGSTTESVTVTADAPLLKTENAEISMNVTGEKFNNLPLNFGAGGTGSVRNWMAFVTLAPGVNGDDQNASINGLPGGMYKILVEGTDVTSSNDIRWTSTVAAASVETIQEFSVQTSNFSAQYAGGLGAMFNFTTKSGTNKIHGSLYDYMTNETMFNAHRFFQANRRDRDRKHDAGGTIGGPVWIPKIYNGRDKTFFFFGWEEFHNKTITFNQRGTVPTAAFRNGDFSQALTNRNIGTDPNGSPILENVIYDPQTQTNINGRLWRTPFPGNRIPTSQLDPVALKIQSLIPAPTNGEQIQNYIYDQPNPRDQVMPSLKIDHNIGSNTKLSFYWSYQSTHDIAGNDPLAYPITAKRDKTATANTYRFNLDRTISPTLYSHLGIGFLRFNNPDSSQAGSLTFDAVKELGLTGATTDPAGFPRITGLNTGNFGGMSFGMGPTNANNYYNNKLNVVLDNTYIRGSHTYKFGAAVVQEMWSDRNTRGAQGIYGFSNAQTGNPAFQGLTLANGTSVGMNYASFLLGMTNSAQVNAVQDPQWRKMNYGLYVEDSWKVSRKLTVGIGLRWDLQGPGHEIHYRNSMFGPTVPNPNAAGRPGAVVFEGYGQGRCECDFVSRYPYAIGPRLSVAYQLDDKTVLRAGWGISYGPGTSWWYLTNQTILGVGFDVFQMPTPATSQAASLLRNGLTYNRTALYAPTLNPGVGLAPGSVVANVGTHYDRNGGRPQRVNQWNIAVQRELVRNLALEAAYVGNRGVWIEAGAMGQYNTTSTERLAAFGLNVNNAADRDLLTRNLNDPLVVARGFRVPYAGYPTNRTLAQSLRPFPQFTGNIQPTWAPLGNSWYDSLQMKLTKRYSHGLDLSAAFTWQKTMALGNGATVFGGGNNGAQGGGINDMFNRDNQKSLAGDYRPLAIVIAFTYHTPKVTTNKVVREVLGNWTLAGILTYRSGSLIGVPASVSSNMNAYTFMGTRQNRNNSVNPFNFDPGCHCIDPNRDTQILNPATWQDVPQGQWGFSAPTYADYRWVRTANEQMSLGRIFPIKERLRFEVRAEFFNAFNRITLPQPTSGNPAQTRTFDSTGRQTGGYGFINVINGLNGARTGQLVARIQF